jgi:hypothetical protein
LDSISDEILQREASEGLAVRLKLSRLSPPKVARQDGP